MKYLLRKMIVLSIVALGVAGFASHALAFADIETKLTLSDAEPGDRFGYAVAVQGTLAVVSARTDDVAAFDDAGAIYIYDRIYREIGILLPE